ncbi:MOSC domain-containing protein [Nocardioides sp. zg-1228]|uniref:MOSC domain-containing protein n=1 Tax=Nocardioides sp. zg-1228 TaxID=2763008 RepID=UPI00197F6A6B|nr:MOSC N-terminal beta barrel domain-containing protein [Nocardioides sp. zg-1228]QSF57514.1 MOSC domain-containing protein [Nocardioides sp. zg-1228]
MLVSGLAIHPVKSTAIRPVDSARVLLGGLESDRTWMVVDGEGTMVTAREAHSLFRIVADTPATDPALQRGLRLRADEMPDLLLDPPSGERVRTRLFGQQLEGVPAGREADAWLRAVLGREDVRLLWCDEPTRRSLDPEHSRPEDFTAFADGYPVTIASLASLRQLNDWIAEGAVQRGEDPPPPLPMERFRPNIVVDGDQPFAEDHWSSVVIGDVRLRAAKLNARCVMTTLDPDSLQTGKEPIRTLAKHRRVGRKTLFAVNLIPDTTGQISVGDPVEVR